MTAQRRPELAVLVALHLPTSAARSIAVSCRPRGSVRDPEAAQTVHA